MAKKDNSPRGSSSKSNDTPVKRGDLTDRKFFCLVYEESEDYVTSDVLSNAEGIHQWAYILHDMDVDDDGVLKKPHYHVLVRFCNPCKLSTCANRLGIPEQFVETCASFKKAEQYLVHRTPDSFDKYQYSPKSVKTNVSSYLYDVGELNECTAMSVIYELLDSGKYTLPQLAKYLTTEYRDPVIYSTFRRNFTIIKYVEDAQRAYERDKAFREVNYSNVTVDMNLVNSIFSKEI